MGESVPAARARSRTPKEQLFRGSQAASFGKNFGTIVRALWPDKPALNLAQRLGCSERAAQFYIDGKRKPSASAARLIFNEMLD